VLLSLGDAEYNLCSRDVQVTKVIMHLVFISITMTVRSIIRSLY